MSKILIVLLAGLMSSAAFARGGSSGGHVAGYHRMGNHLTGTGSNPSNHHVNGYYRHTGGYVPQHYQTNPNHTQRDNYVAKGNYNPHNGRTGADYVDH